LPTSVRSFVRYQTCERDILKTNKLISVQASWHKWSAEQGHDMINFGIRRSKVKVTRRRNRLPKSILATSQELYPTNFSQTWQAHYDYTHCVAPSGIQKGKGKGKCIYMALNWRIFYSTSHSRRSGIDHTMLPAFTPMPAFTS